MKVISTSPLIDGQSYLIPLSITTITGDKNSVLESSRTIFLRIAGSEFSGSFYEQCHRANNWRTRYRGRFNATALFDTTSCNTGQFTVEIKFGVCLPRRRWESNPQPIQTLISWENLAENTSIGLRYAELGNPNNSLQLISSLGGTFAYNFNPCSGT